ncbi:hypothetical protein J4E91_004836 [Alternaria rosae]|nr:hypothetical protein J4E91_004836 [Alternaria rosae]
MVQGQDPESRTAVRDPRKEDIEAHTANRCGRLDREVPIMPNTLAMRLGRGLVLSREDEIVGPGTVGKSLRRVDIEARMDQMSEAVDNLAMALSLVQGHEGMTIDNTMTGLQSIAMLVLGISDPELWRMAELICDTSETPPAHLEITAKPSCDWTRPDGYRAEASHIAERDVMPSVIVADDDELSFIDVSTDDSTEAMSEQNLTHSTPISRQTGDFKDGLYRLALEYDKRDTLSPSPTNPSENLSYRRSGIKRKREDHELSERKSRKVVESRNGVSEASIRKDSAIEWPKEETRVQGVAGRTPESMRMSIRDFFKPHQSRGESLF